MTRQDAIAAAARHGARLPLPDDEQTALETAEELLAGFHCPKCGREWLTGKTTVQLWHSCPVDLEFAHRKQTRRRRVRIPEVEQTTTEEARTAVWHGFADALPGEALLRPLDDDGEEG